MKTDGRKTSVEHWDSAWAAAPDVSVRLPSGLTVAGRDLQRLLRKHVRANQKYLEIGCAPGKMLCWVAAVLGANVAGLDFSPRGFEQTKRLFEGLGLRADLRCEDFFSTTFQPGTFDVVWNAPRELESIRHRLSTGRSARFMFEIVASNSVGGT
jgi:2-polyprenyl-3-methyl-5-hydroxy-6-metoxy-1,4-benzoquinol methylase